MNPLIRFSALCLLLVGMVASPQPLVAQGDLVQPGIWYRLATAWPGGNRCLELHLDGTQHPIRVRMGDRVAPGANADHQLWQFEPAADGSFSIINKLRGPQSRLVSARVGQGNDFAIEAQLIPTQPSDFTQWEVRNGPSGRPALFSRGAGIILAGAVAEGQYEVGLSGRNAPMVLSVMPDPADSNGENRTVGFAEARANGAQIWTFEPEGTPQPAVAAPTPQAPVLPRLLLAPNQPQPGVHYRLVAAWPGAHRCLEARNSNEVWMGNRTTGEAADRQLWSFELVGNNQFRIINKTFGTPNSLALVDHSGDGTAFRPSLEYTVQGDATHWMLTIGPAGRPTIIHAAPPGEGRWSLGVTADATNDNRTVMLVPSRANAGQMWELEPAQP